jgi:hypothetical protein
MACFLVEVVLGRYACRASEHVVIPPLVDNKQEESKMTPRLADLVKRVAKLHTAGL